MDLESYTREKIQKVFVSKNKVLKDLGHRFCAINDIIRRINDHMRMGFAPQRSHPDQMGGQVGRRHQGRQEMKEPPR